MLGQIVREATLVPPKPSKPSDVNAADADLVQACLSGNTQAFEELYRRHSVRLYNLAYRMCGNTADAEDLLQEIFLLVHRKLPTFKGTSALGTWLYRLAMNHCLDHLRSRGHRMDERSEPLDVVHAAQNEYLDCPVTRVDLERAVAQLPQGCRLAFLLHDVEGFEHQEIAKILDVKEGTSKSQVHKARMRIREYLRRVTQPSGAPS
jgi:RNA polymerase sigma-70 factor (ECF subfamily)